MAINFQPIYILASGGARAIEQLDTTSNNLANVNTPGFKKLLMREMSQTIPENKGNKKHLFVFPRFQDTPVILSQGALKKTDNPLDIAIFGSGFFTIETGQGVFLTRSGHFLLNSDGYIVDPNGNYLLDREGKRIKLEESSGITVNQNGEIFQKGKKVARINIVNYENIRHIGHSYYQGEGQEVPADYSLKQGFLEQSNTNGIEAMIELINAQRRFEIYGNLMRSLDAMEQKSNEIGKA
ncbi:MAG TPA: flagellar hook-basal body protein [Persephonella sp.]|uniref:Flagellar basal-body rod protein FlgF n=1 Tax=Persephonella marina (strain DSM 14350 / EX-H1) TaxID=123214 RepID=C0QPC4_PERMH|nr:MULTISPECIES: flagellar hook-basal body protein [Persephonella]ACO03454.1 flagellar basal-body rod protein FlgF [Persephonella marina EX-H1]HCB69865.1 flagellar hook-basal body protein [Persephonella sp.]